MTAGGGSPRAAAALAAAALTIWPATTPGMPHGPHPRIHSTVIWLSAADRGPVFRGIGAISGGGGNSRLLIDYPPKQRAQVLDYLFKPGYGASLQILKLEIGGDANSTDGSEPSVEHSRGHIDCATGYEFWLARQARRLNPAIKLYGLQWTAPGWVSSPSDGSSGPTIWTAADIRYVLDWLNCARAQHLAINYIGGWNEHGDGVGSGGPGWFESLRAALDAHGYRAVRIVAADSVINTSGADVADDLVADPRFRAAVGVLGYHDSCAFPTTGIRCTVPQAAATLGKPVCEAELGHMNAQSGAAAMVRSINRAFIESGITCLIEWPLLESLPPGLPAQGRGLVWADQPWSGHYRVNLMTWAIAQTTQVTRPGWRYLDGGSGQLSGTGWGTYVSYLAPNHSTWSMVVQTTLAGHRQAIVVHLGRRLARSVVHVWRTDLRSRNPARWFVRGRDVRPARGILRYVLRPGSVYSFTTSSGQGRSRRAGPRPAPMPLIYRARPDASREAWGLSAQDGAFGYARGGVITQLADQVPVFWQPPDAPPFPYAVVGGRDWANYRVFAQVRFTAPGQSAGLICRYRRPSTLEKSEHFSGYQFIAASNGAWQLVLDNPLAAPVILASGRVASLGVGTWHGLTLTATGSQLMAKIDSAVVASVADPSYSRGIAGISTSGWYRVDFRNLTVTG